MERLLRHWMNYTLKDNDEHAEIYSDWAVKISSLGNQELSEILRRLSDETKRLNGLLEKALMKVQN